MRSVAFRLVCFFLAIFAVVATMLACSITCGLLVAWVVPSIELGTATLCVLGSAVLLACSSVAMIGFMMHDQCASSLTNIEMLLKSNNGHEENAFHKLDDDQFDALTEQVKEAVLDHITFKDSWNRRKPKARR